MSTRATDRPRPAPAGRPVVAAGAGLDGTPALLAMVGIALVILLAAIDQTIVGTAMPRVVADLHGFEQYAWVATAYLLTSTVMVPITGRLGDLYGRKPFLLAAIVVFVAASAAAGAATSMLFLIVARGAQGIGGGMLMATAFASVGDLFPQPRRRARWQGIITGTFAFASVVGPTAGGFMTDAFGWRSVFYVNLPVGLLAMAVLWLTLPADLSPRRPDARIDWAGAATISLGIVALLLSVEWGGSALPWTSPQIVGLVGSGLALLLVFLAVERRAAEPILPLDLFRDRTVAICSAVSLLLGVGLFGVTYYTPLLAQGVLGLSPSATGALLTPLVLGTAVGSLLSGQLFARIGRSRPLLVAGGASFVLSTVFLATGALGNAQLVLAVELAFCGLGTGMLLPMLTVLVQSAVPPTRLGVGTSTVQFVRLVGSTLGTAGIGSLITSVFSARLATTIAPGTDGRLVAGLATPQALVSPDAQAYLSQLARQIGPTGPAQLEALLAAGRAALGAGIRSGFMVALVVAALTLVLVLWLPAPKPVAAAEPATAMPPVASH